MVELIVHIGAHRTGTTSLQEFLRENAGVLEEACIQLSYPPQTRTQDLSKLKLFQPRAIVSEENILGTMEENISTGALYPNASGYLERYKPLLRQASKVYFSVRSFDDWWASAISFCAQKGVVLPDQALVDRIASLPRSWNDVVDDVVTAAPQAEIVVREFEWKPGTPKQHLNKLTGWPEWEQTTLKRRLHNRRPGLVEIAVSLLEQGDFKGLSKLPPTDTLELFTDAQIRSLRQRYLDDIDQLKRRDDIRFWGQAPVRTGDGAKVAVHAASPPKPKKVLLHIGKTGGSYLKSALSNGAGENGQLVLCGHGDTLISTAKSEGRSRKLAFLFRDPADRFVSGFNARLRQGRPTYNVPWTSAEAAAFSFFERPNDLAEALEASDERLRSAAFFAFENIFHLKHNYRHFLHSAEALRYEHGNGNIIVCCETANLDAHFDRILNALGESSVRHGGVRHETFDMPGSMLSARGLSNIKRFLVSEYEIYSTCCEIAETLGFD